MTMSYAKLTRDQMAARVARDIPEGAYVNLGIGLPTLVANHLPKDREIFLHSENGLLGMGPAPAEGDEDYDLINAGKQPVTLLKGGAYFHHADSFAMMRGGHLDICVLGAFQVSVRGDLANWHTGAPDAIPAVGGAMDLAIGAKKTCVMMEHLTKSGESKIVERCANQAGEDNRNVARMSSLLAGLPLELPGATINRLCGSGMDAVGTAARAIKSGEAQMMIAGGVESMSRAPFVMPKAESAFSRNNAVYDTTIGWRFVNKLMKEQYGVDSMPETAENVATDSRIERAAQDRMALASQQKALAAQAN